MNARGSVILWGLMLCGMIGVLTVGSGTYYESFSRQARETQVRSRLTTLETQVRTMAFQPYSYKCGKDKDAALSTVSVIGTCIINPDYYKDVAEVLMPGANCPGGPGTCGFKMTGPTLTAAGAVGKFYAKIEYMGRETPAMAPSVIELVIPTELLQTSAFDCAVNTPDTPVLTGFDADGKPICRGFSPLVGGVKLPETRPCPKGTYLIMVNWNTLEFQCAPLSTPDNVVGCGQDMAIQRVRWEDGKMNTGVACGYLPEAPFN